MWETILFGALTAYVTRHALKRRDHAAALCAAIVFMVWACFVTATFVLRHVMPMGTAYRTEGEIGAALDVAAGIAVVCVWAVGYKVWPLVLMPLFLLQVCVHRWQAHVPDTWSVRITAWLTIDILNLAQLAWLRFGPDAHELGPVLRRLPDAVRGRGRRVAAVRETAP